MTFGQEIEYVRNMRGYTIVDMCDVLDVLEPQYHKIIAYSGPLTLYQKIALIIATEHPFDSMPKNI